MFFGTVERPPRLSEFDLEIPEKLIAQHPSKTRDGCKLMVLNKDDGSFEHKAFKDIIQYFQNNNQYNLIFSPHPLIKNYSSRNNIDIDFDKIKSNNIIVDFYSNDTVDGSYLNVADVYIGDVSSMVTDFIIKKNKSCIFINSHNIDWQNNKSFEFWNCGKVINKLTEFDSTIDSALKSNKYDD